MSTQWLRGIPWQNEPCVVRSRRIKSVIALRFGRFQDEWFEGFARRRRLDRSYWPQDMRELLCLLQMMNQCRLEDCVSFKLIRQRRTSPSQIQLIGRELFWKWLQAFLFELRIDHQSSGRSFNGLFVCWLIKNSKTNKGINKLLRNGKTCKGVKKILYRTAPSSFFS